jgi:hypothetical protein
MADRSFRKRLRAAGKAGQDTYRGGRFEVAGQVLTCAACSGDYFVVRKAQLNTRGATFFGLDWANRGAHALVCDRCSRIEWFVDLPARVG